MRTRSHGLPRWRRRRRLQRSVGLALVAASVIGAVQLAADAGTSSATPQTITFTGTVSASGASWKPHFFNVPAPSQVSGSLAWTGTASLNLFLRDPNNSPVADSTRARTRPEVVNATISTPGTYRFAAKAVSGSASYTITVTITPLAPPPTTAPPTTAPPTTTIPPTTVPPTTATTVAPPTTVPPPTTTTTTTTAPPPPPSNGTPILKQWKSPFEAPGGANKPPTLSEAIATAKSTDLVVATRYQYRGLVGAMRAANPNLKIYAYSNGAALDPSEVPFYPSSYLARNASGGVVKSMYGNYIADISSSGWAQSRITDCTNALAFSGYDGCYFDMLGSGLLFPGYLSSLPINPATGQAWTHAEWIARTAQMIAGFRAALPVPVIGNGLNNGRRYWANPGGSRPLVQSGKVIVAECYNRLPTEDPNAIIAFSRWKQDLDMITDAEANGGAVLAEAKVEVAATQAQIDRWHKFSLASFLLATNGQSSYLFVTLDPNSHYYDDPWARPNLGAPTSSYYVDPSGAYVRDFATGKVVVNPNATPLTISLGRPMVTLTGATVTALTLAPSSGEVLVG